ncbi:YdcF family protein [Thermosipho atlanticus]|uniref:Uncharacterized SAM-binding protein YcdF, DUF218 family n=1 Tax=Thermosipho atlanticus DSM 15807 TaxID=1123380 RepID=A0A1M5T5B2_9BACT|nr:YdcF family protein [Thermosipho atlanticus]SHH45543.1 Uncharacterized SAM-binding protein YcdF, DUF218 family [Thermosipho atlanticus DSM 15807]
MTLYKVVGSFVQFPGIFIMFFFVITIYLYVKRRLMWRFFLLITLVFYLISSPFFVYLLSNFFYVEDTKVFSKKGIIVILGGGTVQYNNNVEIGLHTLKRVLKGYEVYKTTNYPIVVTGGYIVKGIPESDIMKKILLELGVPQNKIIVENKARTTKENALFTKEIVENYQAIYLVTSYLHMKRSLMLFERIVKREVFPVVCDYPIDFRNTFLDYLPSGDALYVFSQITHEAIGIIKGG